MDLIITAAVYALFGDVLATFLAATVAILIRHRVSGVAIGAGLGASAGFILGVAFFDLIPQAQLRSHDDLIIALGIAIGLSLMVIIDRWLEKYGMGEKEEGDEKKDRQDLDHESRTRKATVISIGMAIHNVPEALPIGAALVISPGLSLLIVLLMTIKRSPRAGRSLES